jgi:hypothetical protein
MENQTKALQDSIRLGEVLNRLKNNAEFKELILEGYIDKGIEGSMAALPYMATKEQRERINDNLFAISKLKQYISSIERDAEKAMYVLEHPEEVEGEASNE